MKNLVYIATSDTFAGHDLQSFLEEDGFRVRCFNTKNALFTTLKQKRCDLAIIDLAKSGNDGIISCAKIKNIFDLPVITLVEHESDNDYVSCILNGLDVCLTKPFNPVKLIAHTKVLLKKPRQFSYLFEKDDCHKISYVDIVIYPDKRIAYCNGSELELTNTEFRLLKLMFEDADRAVSRNELMSKVWRKENSARARATDDTVKRLRRKLIDAGSQVSIDNVWGFGFRLGTNNFNTGGVVVK
ncbi:MAG: response regulator transcription factor [Firmicutes bacterium]|nr:response regulator transcription factor [Bacillota bacterium]